VPEVATFRGVGHRDSLREREGGQAGQLCVQLSTVGVVQSRSAWGGKCRLATRLSNWRNRQERESDPSS